MNKELIDFFRLQSKNVNKSSIQTNKISSFVKADEDLFSFIFSLLGVEYGGVIQNSSVIFGNKIYLDSVSGDYYKYKNLDFFDSSDSFSLNIEDWVKIDFSSINSFTPNIPDKELSSVVQDLRTQLDFLLYSTNDMFTTRSSFLSDVSDVTLFLNPPGTIITGYFPDNLVIPGYIDVDGSLLDKNIYSNLFNIFGDTFGSTGNYFKMMELRGEYLRFLDSDRGVDTGRVLGSFQAQQLLTHVHTGTVSTTGAHGHTMYLGGNGENEGGLKPSDSDDYWPNSAYNTTTTGDHNHTFTTDSTGYAENRVRNIALRAKIRI